MRQHTEQLATVTKRLSREARLRREVARTLDIDEHDLREWNTIICPDCRKHTRRAPICAVMGRPHLPPLFYALAPEQPDGDMPLGLGDSTANALTDLLCQLRAGLLLRDIAAAE